MKRNVALTFTCRGRDRILKDGGSGDWTINPGRALDYVEYVVCCQNLNPKRKGDDWGEASHKHGEAFIVGRVKDVVQVKTEPQKKKRYRFMFSEFATVEVEKMWGKERFPVRYLHESDLPFEISELKFKPLPTFEKQERTFNLVEAKAALAEKYGIRANEVAIIL